MHDSSLVVLFLHEFYPCDKTCARRGADSSYCFCECLCGIKSCSIRSGHLFSHWSISICGYVKITAWSTIRISVVSNLCLEGNCMYCNTLRRKIQYIHQPLYFEVRNATLTVFENAIGRPNKNANLT